MELDHYMLAAALGSLVVTGAAFPVLAALAVAWWPGKRPKYKPAFAITASVLVLGVAGLSSLLALPFELFDTYISPQLRYDGQETIPSIVGWIFTVADWIPYIIVAVGSIWVPIVMRRRLWMRLREAMFGT